MNEIIRMVLEKAGTLEEARRFLSECGLVNPPATSVGVATIPGAQIALPVRQASNLAFRPGHDASRTVTVARKTGRRQWTFEEVAILRQHYAAGKPPKSLRRSRKLKRSLQAIHQKAYELGLTRSYAPRSETLAG